MEMIENNSEEKSIRIANDQFFIHVLSHINEGKSVIMNVAGNSMLPFLKHGEKIVIRPIKSTDYKFGRILLVRSNTGYILHRIVKVSKDKVILAGDGNLSQVEHIDKSDTLAVVEAVIRNNKQENVNSWSRLFAARIWFYSRPLRIVAYKLFK